MEVASWYINPELEQTEIDKRLLAVNHCLQGLEIISSKTNNPDAQNLMNGVLADVAVAKPDPEKHWQIWSDRPRAEHNLRLSSGRNLFEHIALVDIFAHLLHEQANLAQRAKR